VEALQASFLLTWKPCRLLFIHVEALQASFIHFEALLASFIHVQAI